MFLPPPPTRPLGVTILSGLMALLLLIPFSRVAYSYLRLILTTTPWRPHLFGFYLLYFLGMSLIEPAIVYFFWRGQEWARWFVMIAALFIVYSCSVQLIYGVHPSSAALTPLAEWLAGALLLCFLNTSTVRAWFH